MVAALRDRLLLHQQCQHRNDEARRDVNEAIGTLLAHHVHHVRHAAIRVHGLTEVQLRLFELLTANECLSTLINYVKSVGPTP